MAQDTFSSAEVISGASGSVTGDNTGFTLETGEDIYTSTNPWPGAKLYGGGRSAWYKWTCPASGAYEFVTTANGGTPIVDSFLTICISATPAVNDLVIIVQNDDDPDGTHGYYSRVALQASIGQIFYIAVDGYNGSATDEVGYNINNTAVGGYTLTWNTTAEPEMTSIFPITGDRLSTVTITGFNFTTVTDVFFQDSNFFNPAVAASFTIDSDGQLTVTVPAAADLGTNAIQVVNPSGNVWTGAAYGTGVFTVTVPPSPANDNRVSAITLEQAFKGCNIIGTTLGATGDNVAGAFGNTNPSIWYTLDLWAFGGRDPVTLSFDLTGSAAAAYLELFTSTSRTGGTLTLVDSDNGNPATTATALATNSGPRYLIIRIQSPSGSEGAINLSWTVDTDTGPPSNDSFSSPIILSGNSGSQSGDLTGATAECDEEIYSWSDWSLHNSNSLWYKWTPSVTAMARVRFTQITGADYGMEMMVAHDDGTLTLANFENSIIGSYGDYDPVWVSPSAGLWFPVVASENYVIMIQGGQSTRGPFAFDWVVSGSTPPANDNFVNAETIPGGTGQVTSGSIEGATIQVSEPGTSGNFPDYQSVWYTFTVPAGSSGTLEFWLSNLAGTYMSSNNIYARLYTGTTLAGLVLVSSYFDPDTFPNEYTNLAAGTYYLKIYASYGWGSFDLNTNLLLQDVPPGTTGGSYFIAEHQGALVTDEYTTNNGASLSGGKLVASGGISYAQVEMFPNGHNPHGVWHRFYIKHISGDYLWREDGDGLGNPDGGKLGLFRAKNANNDVIFEICLTGTQYGENRLTAIQGSTGTRYYSHIDFGAYGRSTTGEHCIEVFYSDFTGKISVLMDGVTTGISNAIVTTAWSGQANKYDVGFFSYPNTASVPAPDSWQFEFDHVVISDDVSEGPIGPFDSVGYLGVTFHNGWSLGERYANPQTIPTSNYPQLEYFGYFPWTNNHANMTIVDAPSGAYGNALRIYDPTPDDIEKGVGFFGYGPNSVPSEFYMPDDTPYPGYYMKFQISALPSRKTIISTFIGFGQGIYVLRAPVWLSPSGVLSMQIEQNYDLDDGPSSTTEFTIGTIRVGEIQELQVQMDMTSPTWKATAWINGNQSGPHTSNFARTSADFPMINPITGVGFGKLWPTGYLSCSIDMYIMTVATTRMKNSMPLPSLTSTLLTISASGDHVLGVDPPEETFTNHLYDPTFAILDAIGQPSDWSAYDSFDGAGGGYIVGGALARGYNTLTVDTTQTDGPPGLETAAALKAVRNAEDQTVEGFGLTHSYYVPNHNDVLCLSFWVKTRAGCSIGTWWRTGGSPYFGSATFVNGVTNGFTTGGWDRVHLFWIQWFGSGDSATTTLQINGTIPGDATYIKDPRITVNGFQDPAFAYYTDNGGTTLVRIEEGETESWSRINDLPHSTSPDDAVHISTTSTKRWNFQIDETHPLYDLASDNYLEYVLDNTFESPPDITPAIYSAKVIVASSGQQPPPLSARLGARTNVVVTTNDIRTHGATMAGFFDRVDSNLGYTLRASFTMPLALDAAPWTPAKWDNIRLRFGYHQTTADALIGKMTWTGYAPAIRGAGVELLIADVPVNPYYPLHLSRVRYRAFQQGNV